MSLRSRRVLRLIAPLVAAPASPQIVFAQAWPTRPVTIVVPYAAGGPVDTVGRIMAHGLTTVLGQQVVIENIGGGRGMARAGRAAQAAPGGGTLPPPAPPAPP